MANRRSFIAGCFAAGLAPKTSWADVGDPAFLSAGMTRGGSYVLCGLTSDGQIAFQRPLPSRGHAAAAQPKRAEAVAFARRPGTFAIVLDCATGLENARLTAPPGQHFYGHGAFSADGDLLFTTENDFEAAKGIIGVWDTRNGYKRIGEFASGGIGPHDIKMMPDGKMLVIANGGVETHPETGRSKLNIPTMWPNLTYLDLDGQIADQVELDAEFRKNSIRHLAVAHDGTVAFAMQWQGDVSDRVPLLGTHKRGFGWRVSNASDFEGMQGYLGSIAASGRRLAVTSPRGGALLEFDAHELTLRRQYEIEDVCGVAPAHNGFTCTTGLGVVMAPSGSNPQKPHSIRWDNHLVAI
ncbi:DUF1513 domain-containing protein [uncultured Tateyamaria sp.]|uniref:DUF1513 domain-containing protein n=1 Tax=uncultured Tateyamaria sp. TaxID=455651 RepID=UPI00260253D5|nr:DUF1513 domain-containing protein [uncultured Tateyamaria sp.]